MQSMIESLKNLKKSDFFANANLHIHTNFSDGTLSPDEVIEKAKESNLKVISITDHNSIEAYKYIPYENLGDLQVITGVEFDCWYKTNFIHILGYGFDINNEKLKQLCAKNINATRLDIIRFFNKRKAKEVIKTIKEAGGIAVLAHPACCWNINLKKMIKELQDFGLDGIEVYYPYTGHRGIVKFHTVDQIKEYAIKLKLLITGGTDCHSDNITGR
ncbi:MAG: hypothetical protein A2287_09295 [Candidatus Melainabacteria bacterium RIFOXYA12_FULL_32_12]|nr:MAG: hypothetical protein A2104_10565 [Candidatus Melainabacteria bacterium GWF2_32_7]OGI22036.1 MAG: hypothetical protein A2255_05775 [Candidatus Melainabacteria bacterium RIFOXYA2_FULL_32_9]OGI27933.1 MAG: hypothetical protein A2287_09295 [Candidatus Melainabacteria bacterium RIFOXYA12_FULL_32_12]